MGRTTAAQRIEGTQSAGDDLGRVVAAQALDDVLPAGGAQIGAELAAGLAGAAPGLILVTTTELGQVAPKGGPQATLTFATDGRPVAMKGTGDLGVLVALKGQCFDLRAF